MTVAEIHNYFDDNIRSQKYFAKALAICTFLHPIVTKKS